MFVPVIAAARRRRREKGDPPGDRRNDAVVIFAAILVMAGVGVLAFLKKGGELNLLAWSVVGAAIILVAAWRSRWRAERWTSSRHVRG